MVSSIHHAFFPHVVHSLFTNLDHEGLQVARPVCAQWREWADEQQFRHLVVRADLSVWSLRNGTEHLVVSMTPADRHFYELDYGTENLELSARLLRVFRKARVVDFRDDWAHWAYAKLAAWLEANLTHQPDVVRALFDLRTAATAFTYGRTRVYFANLGDQAEERADLGEFTGGVINIACTHKPSLLDQNLTRLLSRTGTENAPASTDEIVIVFHNGRSQLERTPSRASPTRSTSTSSAKTCTASALVVASCRDPFKLLGLCPAIVGTMPSQVKCHLRPRTVPRATCLVSIIEISDLSQTDHRS